MKFVLLIRFSFLKHLLELEWHLAYSSIGLSSSRMVLLVHTLRKIKRDEWDFECDKLKHGSYVAAVASPGFFRRGDAPATFRLSSAPGVGQGGCRFLTYFKVLENESLSKISTVVSDEYI